MDQLIANFSNQLKEAVEIGKSAKLKAGKKDIRNVLISGLGGSGIGGSIVSQLVEREARVPVCVNKDYFIPRYADENTLVVICSYSGNTEETLSAMDFAIKQNTQIICISSGGEVIRAAKQHRLNHIIIPGGMPPRACLGYSLVQLFYTLAHYKIITREFEPQLTEAISLLNRHEEEIRHEAQSIADNLFGKIPVIYSAASYEGVAVRFRQQINENSKMLCWHHVLPEMNHNELVGWRNKNDEIAVVILRDKDDYKKTQTRIEISKVIFAKYTSVILEIFAKGSSTIEKTIYLIHLGDWVSYLLAEKNGVDAVEVNVIDYLKSELAKTKNATGESLVSKLGKTKVKDLRSAIGINQKYLFINELFTGNTRLYDTSIEYLNNCNNRSEADLYVDNNLKTRFSWSKEQPSVAAFMELIERRFKD